MSIPVPLRRDFDAWNKLADQPWRIMSIGLREWAHGLRSMTVGISRVGYEHLTRPKSFHPRVRTG